MRRRDARSRLVLRDTRGTTDACVTRRLFLAAKSENEASRGVSSGAFIGMSRLGRGAGIYLWRLA